MKEFVFSFKNRPFGMAVSPSLPVPTTCLIDFNLVQQLSIPMSNIQYKKFKYNDNKFRIAGHVSITAQCVKSGSLSGNVHVKAFVVIDLHNILDVDSIAGAKMAVRLTGAAESPDVPETVCDTIKKEECKDVPKLSQQLPQQLQASPSVSAAARTSMSDPNACRSQLSDQGHHDVGDHDDGQPEKVGGRDVAQPEEVGGRDDAQPEEIGDPDDAGIGALVRNIAAIENLSPIVANAKVLNLKFGRADLQPDPDLEMDTLLAHCVKTKAKGKVHREPHRQFSFEMEDGLKYSSKHGRYKCTKRMCFDKENVPHNCCYHPQWILPKGFQLCGERCKAALCSCLNKYST